MDARRDHRRRRLRRQRPARHPRHQSTRHARCSPSSTPHRCDRPTTRGSFFSTRAPKRSTPTGTAPPARPPPSCAQPPAATPTTETSQTSSAKAAHAKRSVPHPLGRTQRPLPRHRHQELPPPRRRRAQPQLQPPRHRRRPRPHALHLHRRTRLQKSEQALNLLGSWAATHDQATAPALEREWNMEHRQLAHTGVSVSKFCLGAMMFGAWGNPDHHDSIRYHPRGTRRRHQLHRHRRRLWAGRVRGDRREGARRRPP